MSVSIADIKNILINSYSLMYGNIDTKYITMTRFFEKSPGEFDYTCEVFIPQIPTLADVISTVETKLEEIQTFNETKEAGAPSFIESQLVRNLSKATEKVLGSSQTNLFETSETGEAVVTVKTFGNPTKTVSKKRNVVVNTDNIPPTIHTLSLDNMQTYLYRESADVYRRVDGSRYQAVNDGTIVELTPADPTFIGYKLVHGKNDEIVIQAQLDSFVSASLSGVSLVNDHETQMSGTIVPGITNTTTVYAALTTFAEWNNGAVLDPLRIPLTGESFTDHNLGSTVIYDPTNGANVSSSALSAWYVHLFADNDPFYVRSTLRLERPGFVSEPYIQTSVLETTSTWDVSGTVYSPDRALQEVRVVLVDNPDVSESYIRLYGQNVPVTGSLTLFNTPFEKFSDEGEYHVVVWARDSYGNVGVENLVVVVVAR